MLGLKLNYVGKKGPRTKTFESPHLRLSKCIRAMITKRNICILLWNTRCCYFSFCTRTSHMFWRDMRNQSWFKFHWSNSQLVISGGGRHYQIYVYVCVFSGATYFQSIELAWRWYQQFSCQRAMQVPGMWYLESKPDLLLRDPQSTSNSNLGCIEIVSYRPWILSMRNV